jgi:hypothetical protein
MGEFMKKLFILGLIAHLMTFNTFPMKREGDDNRAIQPARKKAKTSHGTGGNFTAESPSEMDFVGALKSGEFVKSLIDEYNTLQSKDYLTREDIQIKANAKWMLEANGCTFAPDGQLLEKTTPGIIKITTSNGLDVLNFTGFSSSSSAE